MPRHRARNDFRRITDMNPPTPIAALRQQMEQLVALHAEGVLGDVQFHEARTALEQRIVQAVLSEPVAAPAPGPSVVPAATSKASGRLVGGLTLAVIAVAAAGYFAFGSPQAVTSQASASPTAEAVDAASSAPAGAHALTSAQIEGMIDKLAARLKDNPADADGWAMLGRSYAVLGKHELALPALKKAMALQPDDAVLLADAADTLAVVNGRKFEGEPRALIEKALKLDPDNIKALSLAGTMAFERKDHATALKHWEKLAALAPTSEIAKQVQGGIDEARSLLGGAAAKPAGAAASAAREGVAGASISGTVTLAAALTGKAAPDDTLFVFARAAEGPRMPLAILRKQVRDLPLKFTLDDSMAMSPQMKLSSATRVVVGARISKRGDATAQPGDLQGLSAPMSPRSADLKLEIKDTVGP
jgi:cytochrome c-type biogenesis protein CcmH